MSTLDRSLKKKSSLIQYSFTNVYNSRSASVFSRIKPALVTYILASHFAFDLSNLQTIYVEKKIIQAAFKRHFRQESGGFYKLQTAQFVLHCLKIAAIFNLKQNNVYQQNLFVNHVPQLYNKAKLYPKYNQYKTISPIDKQPLMVKSSNREEVYKIIQSKKHSIATQIKWDLFYASNLMCANWILNQIIQLLSNSDKKSPRPVLNQYINDIRILIRSMGSICPILGIRITISGRLGSQKKAMAQQISKCVGKVPLSTLRQNLNYSQSFVRTRFGVIGVNVWVCYRGN
jgi:hypothetical protein|uniref:Ribosomal protein S3 n=1 Tax=Ulva pertusa TaxID=3120 RepID=A0A222AII0_ULVPE|nr:ribosomal protein S3 [Ulva pertusa]ASO76180.1 ribosomal protein S3 [Ulva pertusa]ASO76222.1 ribosomal protein S3 [Ulva pertusa]